MHEAPRQLRPALDPRAEAEADRVAERVTRRVGPDAGAPAADDRLPAPVADALTQEVGDVGHVRVRDDALSAQMADAVGARAFADGSDIRLGSGEGGTALLAHEAAHIALHPQPAPGVVHMKLAGTFDVAAAKGGAPGRRSTHHWDRMLRALREYEGLETQVTAGAEPTGQVRAKMLKLLGKVQEQCFAWQKANKVAGAAEAALTATRADAAAGGDGNADRDTRNKATRAQVVGMLIPRVRAEHRAIQNGTWGATQNLSAATAGGMGATAQGGMNTVHKVTYNAGPGETTGYFKADKGFIADRQRHEREVGISQVDPNYGARAVAMSRIDRLLGTDVLAQVQFATLNGELGTVIADAGGTAGDKLKLAWDDVTRRDQAPANAITLTDPELQRGLNKLQLLDVICGQLDRHQGNYHVRRGGNGSVTDIVGIDPDMAFGQDMLDPSSGGQARVAHNYRGVPLHMDAQIAHRIEQLTDADIRGALEDILTKAEVDATIARLAYLKTKIGEARQANRLVGAWDAAALAKVLGPRKVMGSGQENYMQTLAVDLSESAVTEAKTFAKRQIEHLEYQGPNKGRLAAIPQGMRSSLAGDFAIKMNLSTNMMYLGELSGPAVKRAAIMALQSMLADTATMRRLVAGDDSGIRDKIEAWLQAAWTFEKTNLTRARNNQRPLPRPAVRMLPPLGAAPAAPARTSVGVGSG